MTKREKYPPLKPWQLEVVKKHETRNRLLKGSSHDRAKYWYMMTRQINEKKFDKDAEEIKKTAEYKRMFFRQEISKFFAGFVKNFKGIKFNGQR
ncbi:hypothetical protein SporoP37_00355 [Sporosarcina sp. P37]|uniref:hypothetical protein n=1 Tax=unclassified Sporosarcina TaxID=2647733 RepID=UPI000A17E529|nr:MULTISPECIES: hypothetical protein [unclassified Sporosarcina]ARK23291.1 hypothetical protein SporoP37_00355 [Sporosarcina sp. P37]PID19543.1 hypothetical protein CSV62_03305 [Sporosarcina sp. P35]